MSAPVTVLGTTVLWPTTGDVGYSNNALQLQLLLAQAVLPIEGLYNNVTGAMGSLALNDQNELTFTYTGGPTVIIGGPSVGSVTSVGIASPSDLTVSGSPITTAGVINLNLTTTGVVPGSYTLSNVTVDSKGRITAITSGTPPPTGVTQITAGTNITISPPGGTGNVTINSTNTGGTVTNVSASGSNGVTTNVTNPTTTPNIQIGLGDITPTSITVSGPISGSNISGTNTGDQTITATGDATGVSTGSPATTLPLTLAASGVLAGDYTLANITVDEKGRVTSASSGVAGAGTVTSVSIVGNNGVLATVTTPTTTPAITIGLGNISPSSITMTGNITTTGTVGGSNLSGINTGNQTITLQGDVTGSGTGTFNTTLANSGVVAGPYTNANITVDAKGRVTSAANGISTPSVWGTLTGDISNQIDLNTILTAISHSALSTGVTTLTDTIGLIALDDTTLRFKPVQQAIFYDQMPLGIDDMIVTLPQVDYPLSNLALPGDGIFIRFVGMSHIGGVAVSNAPFSLNESALQYGYIIVKSVAGVISFLDGAAGPRNVFTWPDFAGDNASINEFLVPESNVAVTPNSNLTVKNSSGVIKGLGINWGTGNVNERAVPSLNPMSFITVNPSTALTTTLPAVGTAVQVTQYWNGTAMATLPTAGSGTVQRFLITIAGQMFLQVGEFAYTNFADAVDAISIAPFTPFIPQDTYIELCRFATHRSSTILTNNADAVFSVGGGAVGGGSGAGTVTSVAIAGTGGVTTTGSPITSNGTITVGLSDTGVVAGPYTLANITVDAKGRISAAANGTAPPATWGTITGDINNQTDLVAELGEKLSLTGGTMTGELNFSDDAPVDPVITSIIVASPDSLSNPELQLFGGDWNTTFDDSIPTAGVRLGGNYIALESSDISVQLNSAQVGSRVIVAGLTERGNSILGVEPPPVPDYVVSSNGTNDVTIYTTGPLPSPWTAVTDPLTITRDIAINEGIISFEVLIENTGNKGGEFEIGIGINGADPTGITSIKYSMGPEVQQIYASTNVNVNPIADGTTAQLYARATSVAATGFTIFARNSLRSSLLKVSVLGSGGGSGGTVTSVALFSPTGSLTVDGSPIVTNGTINVDMAPTLSAGSYTNANITVDGFGRVVVASNGSSTGAAAGSNTEIQFNAGGTFGASPNLTWIDGTGLTMNGDLSIQGVHKITSNFTSGLAGGVLGRTVFQSNSPNGQTFVSVIPNGTSQAAGFTFEKSSGDLTNSSFGTFSISATSVEFASGTRGTGPGSPVYIRSNNFAGIVVDQNGNVVLGATPGSLATNATSRFAYINNMPGTPTGIPIDPLQNSTGTPFTGKTPITVDTTNNLLYFYSNGLWRTPSGGGGGSPAGNNTEIQFNNSGAFGSSPRLRFAGSFLQIGDATNRGPLQIDDFQIAGGQGNPGLSGGQLVLKGGIGGSAAGAGGKVSVIGGSGAGTGAGGDVYFEVGVDGSGTSGGKIQFATFGLDLQLLNSGAIAINTNTGTSGQVLTSAGASAPPTWQTPSGGGGGVPEAPIDGNGYIRKDAAWTSTISGGTY